MNPQKKPLRCRLFGHRQVGTDSGYPVCECGTHGYWDAGEWDRWRPLNPVDWYRRISWTIRFWLFVHFVRCDDCGKLMIVFGRKVGEHEDCIPF